MTSNRTAFFNSIYRPRTIPVALTVLLLSAFGCGQAPDLPPWDSVPLIAAGQCDHPREVRAACVIDGDTFDIGDCTEEGGERIRLLGVDAPEVAHDNEPAECFGAEARRALADRIEGRSLTLTFDADCFDVYGRTLAYAWENADEPEPVLLNEWLLAAGYVRRYVGGAESSLVYGDVLDAALLSAQDLNLGLWDACSEEDA